MIDQLKVIELLRYNINSNVERVAEKMIKIQSDSSNEMISAVFATGFSLVSVEIGDAVYRLIRESSWINSLAKEVSGSALRHFAGVAVKSTIILVLFALLFIITYYIAKTILALIISRRKAKEIRRNKESDYKKFIDDFDHTACDALLFSEYFLGACKVEGGQKKLFTLYESMYYLSKAQAITETIFRNKDYCVSSSVVNKIAVHRLINAVRMMLELQNTMEEVINGLDMSKEEINSLMISYRRIDGKMKELECGLQKLQS